MDALRNYLSMARICPLLFFFFFFFVGGNNIDTFRGLPLIKNCGFFFFFLVATLIHLEGCQFLPVGSVNHNFINPRHFHQWLL